MLIGDVLLSFKMFDFETVCFNVYKVCVNIPKLSDSGISLSDRPYVIAVIKI